MSVSSVMYSVVRVPKPWSHRWLWTSLVDHKTKQKDMSMSMRTGLVEMKGVCVTGVGGAVKEGGECVLTTHHIDVQNCQGTNLINLKT